MSDLLSRHGAMTVGRDVMDAYNKMEKLEHTARVVLAARLQGPVPPLPAAEVERLQHIAEKYKARGSLSRIPGKSQGSFPGNVGQGLCAGATGPFRLLGTY